MKKLMVLIVILGISASLTSQEKSDNEKEAIIMVIDAAYVQGLQNGKNLENIDKGFHPGFNLLGVDQNNNLTKYPIYNWSAGVKKAVEAGQKPDIETTAKYPMIDITGTAAVAKVQLFRGERHIYTDYLSLYKFEEGWRIVGKVYYSIPEN